jgi:hypothetical protein
VVLTFILGVKKLLLNKIIKRRNAMSFLRHVGKHGDRKVAVIFREVPGEPHMCLVTYTELLNQHIHNPMIKCIESDIGQNSENLADALNRTYTTDGNPILQVLHREGQLKKVNTELVIMTPAPNTKIKLNELNKILNEMKQGEAAVKRLAEIDSSRGLQDPADVARRMRGNQNTPAVQAGSNDALGDNAIATNLRTQAEKMAAEARGLLAESERMLKEASNLDGSLQSSITAPTEKRGRGRPAKAKVVA